MMECPYCDSDREGIHKFGCPNRPKYFDPSSQKVKIDFCEYSVPMKPFYEAGYLVAYEEYERKLNNIKTYYEDVIEKLGEAIRNLSKCDDTDCEYYDDCCRMNRHEIIKKLEKQEEELSFWRGMG